jgi:sugar-specific transcriptional regulator TrmB
MEIPIILKNFGLNEKEIAVYLALVDLGPSPVRLIAQKTKINRGTTYDILKALQQQGLVSFYDTKTHQHFAAEPPEKLVAAVEEKQENLQQLKSQIQKDLPTLKSLFEKQGGKPVVRLYEGIKGIRSILEDVLSAMVAEKNKQYYIFSSQKILGAPPARSAHMAFFFCRYQGVTDSRWFYRRDRFLHQRNS